MPSSLESGQRFKRAKANVLHRTGTQVVVNYRYETSENVIVGTLDGADDRTATRVFGRV